MLGKLAFDIGNAYNSPFGKSGGKTIGDLISLILTASLSIAGVLILVLIIFAGISLISSAGSNNPEQAEKGKKAATAAIIGFIIILSAYWIIRIIEIISGTNFITNPGI
jgi:hypothetical protein